MNTLEKINKLVGHACLHGSPGYPIREVISAIDIDIKNEQVSIEFRSGFCTKLSVEDMEDLLDQWEDGYGSIEYNPWSCSVTRRSGMLEELIIT